MPTYDYKREDGTVFEHRQGINDAPLSTCPETGQSVTRMISGGAGVVYKGEGWYVKEYGSGSSGPSNDSTTSDVPSESTPDRSSDSDAK